MGKSELLKIAGICGIISPIITFTCIFLAIANYPSFSWNKNDLSDIGISSGMAAPLFNASLVLSAALSLVFTYGLWHFLPAFRIGKLGVGLFGASLLMLAATGVFNKSVEPLHTQVSMAFFFLFPLALLFICAAFLQAGKSSMGNVALMVFLLAIIVWGLQWRGIFGKGLAIPELLTSLALSLWGIAVSLQMLDSAGKKPIKA